MAETFLAILTAHLVGDFVLPSNWRTRQTNRPWMLIFQAALVTILSFALLGLLHWSLLLILFVTRLLMDAVKWYGIRDTLGSFVSDQVVRFAVLAVLAWYYADAANSGWWVTHLKTDFPKRYFASLCFVSGLILCVPAGGILIGKATKRFTDEIAPEQIAGLTKGGQYIGWLERSLVMLLLFINQPAGIGFLITAKSILRFGEIKDASQRKMAEYIIIGTFFSFGWAILVSVLTQRAIEHWLP